MKTAHAVGTTDTEAALLAATAAAIAAGKDPFGDDDEPGNPAANAAGAEDEVDADADHDAGPDADADADPDAADEAVALTAEQLAEVAADAEDEHGTFVVDLAYKAKSPAEFAEQRKELRAKKAKAFKDYADGVIEPEDYSRIQDEVDDALEAMTVDRTLHTANAQHAEAAQTTVLDGIMAAAKRAGTVDYAADAGAAKRFDLEMQLLSDDGVKRSFADQAALAHKNVLAVMGKKVDPAADQKPESAKPRENGKPPMTLRDIPAAANANTGGDWKDAINKLSGQDYEAAYARLTKAQRESLLAD